MSVVHVLRCRRSGEWRLVVEIGVESQGRLELMSHEPLAFARHFCTENVDHG